MIDNHCPFCKNFISSHSVVSSPIFKCIYCSHEFVDRTAHEWINMDEDSRKNILKRINKSFANIIRNKISGSSYNAKYNFIVISSLERTKSKEYVNRLIDEGFNFYPISKDEILCNNEYVNYNKKQLFPILADRNYENDSKILIRLDYLETRSLEIIEEIKRKNSDIQYILNSVGIYYKLQDVLGMCSIAFTLYKLGFSNALSLIESAIGFDSKFQLEDKLIRIIKENKNVNNN